MIFSNSTCHDMSRTQFEVEIEELEKLGVKLQNLSNMP
jgi:ribosomal 50S subunit-associated protein YjgA (DUF615 family)